MPGPWPRRADSAPPVLPIASPLLSGLGAAAYGDPTLWSARARATSRSCGPCSLPASAFRPDDQIGVLRASRSRCHSVGAAGGLVRLLSPEYGQATSRIADWRTG